MKRNDTQSGLRSKQKIFQGSTYPGPCAPPLSSFPGGNQGISQERLLVVSLQNPTEPLGLPPLTLRPAAERTWGSCWQTFLVISLHLKQPTFPQRSLPFAEVRETNEFPFEQSPAWVPTALASAGTEEEMEAFLESQIAFSSLWPTQLSLAPGLKNTGPSLQGNLPCVNSQGTVQGSGR